MSPVHITRLKLVPLEGFLIKKDLMLLNNKISEPQRGHNCKMKCVAPWFPNPHGVIGSWPSIIRR